MQEKSLHIVFQMLNFIFGSQSTPYRLSADEEKLLIALARHKGPKGIYPSVTTLSKELKRTPRNVRNTIKRLEDKKLINVIEHPGKSNNYELVIHTPVVHDSPDVHDTPVVDDLSPLSSTTLTPVVHDSQSVKEVIQKKNRERDPSHLSSNPKTQKPRPTLLPDDWVHADIHEDRGMAMEMPSDEFFVCLDKFKAYVKANQIEKMDWDAEFDLWLIREGKYRAQQEVKNSLRAAASGSGGGSGRGQEEMRSRVPWLKPDPLRVINIINKGNLNGLGSK